MSVSPNPKILAIDTATDVCSVALTHLDDVKEVTVVAAREHTQRILPMIESILLDSHLSITDLDAIAVANGPGSFTGLRIGLSIAQGLAYGADLPLIPVSTLAAMAHSVVRTKVHDDKQIIIPAIDARMDEIYWSVYQLSAPESINSLEDEYVSKPANCYEYSEQLVGVEKVIAVGSGWGYADVNSQNIPKNIDVQFHATARDIAELALLAFSKGDYIDPMKAQPSYLRNEISWQKRQRTRSVV